MRALVAIQAEDSRETWIQSLAAVGVTNVVLASDGLGALMAFTQGPLDILIMDLTLPRLDGIRVVQQVRSRLGSAPIVVLVSAVALKEKVVEAKAAGVDWWVLKPLDVASLTRLLLTLMAGKRQAVPLRQA
jgi:CheY-like chemotaxis protein